VSTFTEPWTRACCMTPIQDETEHCMLGEERTSALVDPGLSSLETVAKLNQFLFRARPGDARPGVGERVPYMPFGSAAGVAFDTPDDEYCIDISAQDIATGATHEYPELHSCVSAGHGELGTKPLHLDPAFLANESCLQPPVGREEDWCAANEQACAGGVTERCKLYRYACQNGPLPNAWREAARMFPERNIPFRGPDTSDAEEHCSVSAPGIRHSGGGLAWLVLLALFVRRASRAAR
jgi:hypothetical protein